MVPVLDWGLGLDGGIFILEVDIVTGKYIFCILYIVIWMKDIVLLQYDATSKTTS